MSNWRKENKLRLKVTYSLDKYKESDDYNSQMETVEGEMTYVNMPFANSFLNMELDDGNIVSIAYPLVLTIHWIDMPKWTKLTESR